jgi:hypothetical protein
MFYFVIELIGGPDDGAVFQVHRLDPYWEMMVDSWDPSDVPKTSMYWKSDEITKDGHIRYYSQDAVALYWKRKSNKDKK